jgi:HSP20 family protein
MQRLQLEMHMAEKASQLPVKKDTGRCVSSPFRAFEQMRKEIDSMFDDFGSGFWYAPSRSPFDIEPGWRRDLGWEKMPAVDVVEKDKAYEISAELPGMDEKDINVAVSNGVLTVKGEKKETREEKQTDDYVSERHYGSFARSFRVPQDVDASKIEAKFEKGVLALTLPKTAAAQKPEQKIAIKTAA